MAVPEGVSESVSGLKIFLLGPPRIELSGEQVDTDRRKAIALLAYLAMTNERHSRESLATLFWPECDRSRAYAYLRRTLWEINNALGEGWLEADRGAVQVDPDAGTWLDVAVFRRHLGSWQAHRHAATEICSECILPLTEAVRLYRGDFLAGFGLRDSPGFDDWQYFEAEGLRRELAGALQKLVAAYRQQGDFRAAIGYASRWLNLDQLNEEAHRQLMQLYAWSGRRSAALYQHEKCVRILAEELGVSPQEETTRLRERIQSGQVGSRAVETERVALSVVSPTPGRPAPALSEEDPSQRSLSKIDLVAHSTPFVGRRAEVEEIATLLRNPACRLLTLFGPGGIGKTRLALQAALEVKESFPHGIYFVPLASLRSPSSIVPAISEALGLEDGVSQKNLRDALAGRQVLLVMDNFERLISGAGVLNDIIARVPGTKFLVTSRERLRLRGEWVMEVGGMAYPTTASQDAIEGYSAIELFVACAGRSRVGFDPEPAEYPAIARIAHLVQGMPLALELAAAWVGVLSCQEIANEIEQGLDLLGSTLADLPERQRSIRVMFDSSWALLAERERECLTSLSVFRGGFTRSAAKDVAQASLLDLQGLVDTSLLQRTGEGRFKMHELLRQYAAERLAEDPRLGDQAGDRHCAYFCAALVQWAQMLRGPRQKQAMAEMGDDLENIQAAWDYAVGHSQSERLDQMAEPVGLLYRRQLRLEEGEAAYAAAVAALVPTAEGVGKRVLARLLAFQAWFQAGLGNYQIAGALCHDGQAALEASGLASEDVRMEKALISLGLSHPAVSEGGLEAARGLLEESVALFQEAGDLWWENLALIELGQIYWFLEPQLFKQYLEEYLERSRARSDQLSVGDALRMLGLLAAYDWGDIEHAKQLLEESLQVLQQLDEPVSSTLALGNQAALLNINGQFADLLDLRKRELAAAEERGDRGAVVEFNMLIGETYQMLGQYEEAEAYGRLAVELAHHVGFEFDVAWARWFLGLTLLGAGKYAEARGAFQECALVFRDTAKATFASRALAGLSRAELALGSRVRAWEHALRSLESINETPDFTSLLYTLPTIALLMIAAGEAERAVEVYAVVSRYPFVANSVWFEEVFGQGVEAGAATLSHEVESQARARGAALDPWQVAKDLVEEAGTWEKEARK